MKRCIHLAVTTALILCTAGIAGAVEFTARGEWLFGVGAVNAALVTKVGGQRTQAASDDKFAAVQRLRLRLTAVASESLSGVVWFEIGDTTWGQAESGGALGADGKIVEVKNAFLDWSVPGVPLKMRMGIQTFLPPSVAGGLAVLPRDVAGIVSTWTVNENVAVTGVWLRPFNDNFSGRPHGSANGYQPANFLDNVDIAGLIVPITLDGIKISPWLLAGAAGKNYSGAIADGVDGRFRPMNNLSLGTLPYDYVRTPFAQRNLSGNTAYSPLVFAGLPIVITRFDPWNFELDLNYAYSGGFGRYDSPDYRHGGTQRGNTRREGWLAKALVEYKTDWGTPGIFGWYGSGDDGNVKNGSERLPTIAPTGNISSFMGDGPLGWTVFSGANHGYDLSLAYSGTWGVGAQVRNFSFMDNLSHTVRVAWWGGANSPSMVKHLGTAAAITGHVSSWSAEGVYLTTNDGLLEINIDTTWKVYENLSAILELGYIVNAIDKDTWERPWQGAAGKFSKADAFKAALVMNYSF